MQIHSGLFDHMVLQRTRRNASEAAITGAAKTDGPLLARVTRGGKVVKGFAWTRIGDIVNGNFTATLRGLPAGGPYDIELKTADGADKLKVKDILVGDVWLCAGQSNMQGVGLDTQPLRPNPTVRAFYMDDRWAPARDPMHNLEIAVDAVHNNGERREKPLVNKRGVGPATAFGHDMLRRTGVPQGLIACAHGGTCMQQWDPSLKDQGGKSLYGAMIRRLQRNGGKVAGMIWYQGESDAVPDRVNHYTQRMIDLVAALRRDAGDDNLPIAIVQLSRVVSGGFANADWNSIQEQQRCLPRKIRHLSVVPAIDLSLDDTIHISGVGCRTLGQRLAGAISALRKLPKAGKPPIELKRVFVETDKQTKNAVLFVDYANVEGRLTTGGARPSGFTLLRDGQPQVSIFDTQISGNRAIVRTCLPAADFTDVQLQYGYGTDPICNITDVAGRAVPVFGPLSLPPQRPTSAFLRHVKVSGLLPSAGKLHDLAYPGPASAMSLELRRFNGQSPLCDRHLETQAAGGDRLLYFVADLHCDQPMPLTLCLGYDGPVKMWVDGQLMLHDPDGTNPAIVDAKQIPFQATAGKHEVIVALGTNNGRAWGIFLRAERSDVTPSQFQKNPAAVKLPKLGAS